jgi:hypothetical protein
MPALLRRRALSVAIAVTLAFAVPVTLGGCSLVRNAVEGASGVTVDIGGESVPDDFPTEDVPLTEGDVVYGASVGDAASKVWNVTISVADATAIDTITAELTAAGFAASPQAGADATGSTRGFAKESYAVLVLVSQNSGDSTWTANYTVTLTPPSASPTPAPAG